MNVLLLYLCIGTAIFLHTGYVQRKSIADKLNSFQERFIVYGAPIAAAVLCIAFLIALASAWFTLTFFWPLSVIKKLKGKT